MLKNLLIVSILKGLDWHGPSAAGAWACVSALRIILSEHNIFHAWRFAENTKVILLGHSNGGQGVWYMASRYPDRVLAGKLHLLVCDAGELHTS